MDKDLVSLYTELQKKRFNQAIVPFEKKLPRIIEKYGGNTEFKNQIDMLKNYEEQIIFVEEKSRKYIEELEKWRDNR